MWATADQCFSLTRMFRSLSLSLFAPFPLSNINRQPWLLRLRGLGLVCAPKGHGFEAPVPGWWAPSPLWGCAAGGGRGGGGGLGKDGGFSLSSLMLLLSFLSLPPLPSPAPLLSLSLYLSVKPIKTYKKCLKDETHPQLLR